MVVESEDDESVFTKDEQLIRYEQIQDNNQMVVGELRTAKWRTDIINLFGRRIYLDLVNYEDQKNLERNLLFLGAVLENCFSKDVSMIITNKENHYNRQLSNHENYEILTRGKFIAKKAHIKQNIGSSNVLDCAKLWNIAIVNIYDVECLIKKKLQKMPAKINLKNKKRANMKRLKPCYIKIDDSSKKFSPLFRTYLDFPTAHSSSASHLTMSEKENKAESRQHFTSSIINSYEPCKNSLMTTGEMRRFQRKRLKTLGQQKFCEVCHTKFESITEHLPTSVHREFVNNSANYVALDNLISQLPSLKNLNMENGLDDWQFKVSRSLNQFAQSLNQETLSSSDQVLQLSLPSSCFMIDNSESYDQLSVVKW